MEEVREFMHAPVISVDPQTTAQDAAAIMGEKGIGSLLIMKNDDYLGILTKTDLVKNVLAGGLDPQCTKVLLGHGKTDHHPGSSSLKKRSH